MEKRKLLITGAFGYVGSRVAQFLAKNSDYTLILASRKTGREKPNWLNNGYIAELDLNNQLSIENVLDDVTAIIHLAAPNEIESRNYPYDAYSATAFGTYFLLEAAIKKGVKRFIYFSTAHVYGSPLIGTLTENMPTRPQHPYSISHRWAEDLVLYSSDSKQIDGVVLRLSNSVGAPAVEGVDRWSLIVNDLCKQAIQNKKLILKTSGLQKRDFITLYDVSRAVEYFLKFIFPDNDSRIYNLGGGRSISILEITEIIQKRSEILIGHKPVIEVPSLKNTERNETLNFSIEKLVSTGFSLIGSIEKEVDDTLMYCQRIYGRK